MGNLFGKQEDTDSKEVGRVFLLGYQDDDGSIISPMIYYKIPIEKMTIEIQDQVNKFLIHGSDLSFQCFNIAEKIDENLNFHHEYPEWIHNGKVSPETIFEDYVTLKKLVKNHPDSKIVLGENIKNLNVELVLAIRMVICFASQYMCNKVRNQLVWN